MNYLTEIFFVLALSNFCYSFTSDSLKVELNDGIIVGKYTTSISGKTIRSFTSIPYAAPPVGDLRFRAPQKPQPWGQNTLYAQNESPMCVQTNYFVPGDTSVVGQEDCLYLNVYAPDVNVHKGNKKLPVMVWFHGGAFIFGRSGHSFYGPGYLLEHDVILVAGNYRLGPLGFLSTEDTNCPGNFAFKDQAMVLEWVQNNIGKFGGDKNSVTIFGESAGGTSVSYHMFSPRSQKLFHRAISQSGDIMDTWAVPPKKGLARKKAFKLAKNLGCKILSSSKKIIDCLRSIDADKITNGVRDFLGWESNPPVIFGPVIECFDQEEEPFVADPSFNELSLNIPWMAGATSEDGLFETAGLFESSERMNDLADKWQIALPLTFFYDHLPEYEIDEVNAAIYEFYFGNEQIGKNQTKLTKLWTDGWFGGFMSHWQTRLKYGNRANTFIYLFSHRGSCSFSEYVGGDKETYYGTSHQDDLLYLFPMRQFEPTFFNSIPTPEDVKLRKLMTKLWVNFATTGNPTPDHSGRSEIPVWTPASEYPPEYMRIGNENGNSDKLLVMEKNLFRKEAKFWANLRNKYALNTWILDNVSYEEDVMKEE